jgi:hypothetical protein
MNVLLLLESKQSIIKLGYPAVLAALFYKRYGNKAYLIAKWYKDYKQVKAGDERSLMDSPFNKGLRVVDYIKLYDAAKRNDVDDYVEACKFADISEKDCLTNRDNPEWFKETIKILLQNLEEKYFDTYFFSRHNKFILDILSGKIKNLNKYDHLPYDDAQKLYDEFRLFSEQKPLKLYKNGYKWVNIGNKCTLVAKYMANCGSVGLMSDDKDKSGIVLFDNNNKPHVILVYSPNQNRISSEEGVGHSEVKPEYHEYILDLTTVLSAKLDLHKTQGSLLKMKYIFGNDNIQEIKFKTTSVYSRYYKVKYNKRVYYSDGYEMVDSDSAKVTLEKVKSSGEKLYKGIRGLGKLGLLQVLFNTTNKSLLKSLGLDYVSVYSVNKN